MKVSHHIQSRLGALQEKKRDENLQSALHWITTGIRTGGISGGESELSDFILSHLTDRSDIGDTNQDVIIVESFFNLNATIVSPNVFL